jgi:acetyl-CoA acetyltransferase
MSQDVYVVGAGWRSISGDTDLQLDELAFEVVSEALRAAGINRQQVNLSVISSLDLYDGRSISNALLAPAAAGYLGEEFRVEGDALAAVYAAVAAIVSGQAEVAVVTSVHVPEIGTADPTALSRFREKVSSYTVDAFLNRPVGVTSEVTIGLHAAARVDAGAVAVEDLAAWAAADVRRGAARRGVRSAVSVAEVAAAPMIVAPLTELMMPASAAGVGAVVLATDVVTARLPRPLARIAGWGMSVSGGADDLAWLDDPAAATRAAANAAYEVAGVDNPSADIDAAELTDLSPALTPEIIAALGIADLDHEQVNASGGVRSNFPGIANGLLRLIEAAEAVAAPDGPHRAVAHSVDDLSGLVTSAATVFVLEKKRDIEK